MKIIINKLIKMRITVNNNDNDKQNYYYFSKKNIIINLLKSLDVFPVISI